MEIRKILKKYLVTLPRLTFYWMESLTQKIFLSKLNWTKFGILVRCGSHYCVIHHREENKKRYELNKSSLLMQAKTLT